MKSKIGLIICTRNRANYLQGLLSNIESKDFLETILIVDSSSNEESIKIVDSFKESKNNIIEYIKSEPGLPHQRNIGISWIANQRKTVNVIAFLDDDARIDSNYFKIAARYVEMNKNWVAFTGNPGNIIRSRANLLRRICMLDSKKYGKLIKSGHTTLPNPAEEIENVDWLPGISMFINPSVLKFEKFNASLRMYYEDVEMSLRLRKYGKLHVVKKMNYTHLYAPEGRESIASQILYTLGIKWELAPEHPNYLSRRAIIWSIMGSLILGFVKYPISRNRKIIMETIRGNFKFIYFTLVGKSTTQKINV